MIIALFTAAWLNKNPAWSVGFSEQFGGFAAAWPTEPVGQAMARVAHLSNEPEGETPTLTVSSRPVRRGASPDAGGGEQSRRTICSGARRRCSPTLLAHTDFVKSTTLTLRQSRFACNLGWAFFTLFV